MDIEHDNLLNASRYSTLKDLKKLYRAYGSLKKLALSGNRAAVAVYLDLTVALEHPKVPSKQRRFIQLHLIEGYTLFDIAVEECHCPQNELFFPRGQYEVTAIADVVNSGLNKIKKLLHSEVLYGNRRDRGILESERSCIQEQKAGS